MENKDSKNDFNFDNPAVIVLTLALVFIGGYMLFSNKSDVFTQNLIQGENSAQSPQLVGNNPEPVQHFNSSQINAEELAPYLPGVGNVVCWSSNNGNIHWSTAGSGSLWQFDNQNYVLTNQHVVQNQNFCRFFVANPQKPTSWIPYDLNLENNKSWNSYTDIAVIALIPTPANATYPEEKLDYKISTLRYCPSSIAQGSPVIVVGYPAYTTDQIAGTGLRTVSDGIIASVAQAQYPLPDNDYYVSAKMDSGNSGGVAFSKDENGLCLLGVPTWISLGNYTSEGKIQNINNITWTPN